MIRVEEFGEPDGKPVLVRPGSPGSRRLFRPDAELAAREFGLRLLSYDRPGYGGGRAGGTGGSPTRSPTSAALSGRWGYNGWESGVPPVAAATRSPVPPCCPSWSLARQSSPLLLPASGIMGRCRIAASGTLGLNERHPTSEFRRTPCRGDRHGRGGEEHVLGSAFGEDRPPHHCSRRPLLAAGLDRANGGRVAREAEETTRRRRLDRRRQLPRDARSSTRASRHGRVPRHTVVDLRRARARAWGSNAPG
jgi:hypothetical protein